MSDSPSFGAVTAKVANNTLGNPIFVNIAMIGGAILGGYILVKYFLIPDAGAIKKAADEKAAEIGRGVDTILDQDLTTSGQMIENRTRADELKGIAGGLFGEQGGDRALDDLLGNPVGTTLFLITGDTSHLKGN